jgi:excisionase family DNA binding protein
VEAEDVGLETLDLLDIPAVAGLLKVSTKQVRRLVASRRIKSIRVGANGIRVTRMALAAYIREQEDASEAEQAETKQAS